MSQDQNWQPPGQDPETQQDWPQGPQTPPPGWAPQAQGQDQPNPPGWGQPQQPAQGQQGWDQQNQPTGWAPQTPLQQPQGGQNPPQGWSPGPQTPPPGWAPQTPQTPPPGWAPQGPQTPPPGAWQPPGQHYGPQPPGYLPQGQFAQPGRKNKGAVIAVAIAGVAVLALVAAVVFVAFSGDEKTPVKIVPPQDKSAAAATTLKTVPGLHYVGTFESGGDTIQADVSITRSGSVAGQLTIDGDQVELMVVDGGTYVKAPRSYWRKQSDVGEAGSAGYADRWAKAPAALSGFDLRGKLLPSQLGDGVSKAQPLVPPTGQPTAEAIAGTQAIGFEGTDYQYYVSDAAPYKLVKIKGGGAQTFDLDVTELTAAQMGDVFTQLKDKVKNGLSGAPDPTARVVFQGKFLAKSCNPNGCTIESTYRNTGSSNALVIYEVVLTKGGKAGGPRLGTCKAGAKSIKPGTSVKISCRVTDKAWQNWVKSIRGKSSYWVDPSITVQAVDGAKVDDLIGKLDQEQQGA
ncbi:hypothetical protein [Actinocorallia longicatena]|uniref:Uncharacterized protein n=1 Tax=Actinocorallia longicatena TaxID=111803 RepID=A0ABP6QKB3_9ACTN